MSQRQGLYRVAYRLTGLASLPNKTNWLSSSFKWLPGVDRNVQLVGEWRSDDVGTAVPGDIRIVMEVLSASPEEAVQTTGLAADLIARVIEFQAGCPHVQPKAIALLEATPGISRRRYRQWIRDAVPARPKRPVPVPDIETTASSLGLRSEAERDASLRSLKWYTDALNESESIDRFLKAWVGLESVGVIINRRMHKSGWRKCKTCLGELLKRTRDERQERGIRHTFSIIEPSKPDAFDRLKKARNKLVHGAWGLSKVKAEVEPFAELTMRVLGSALPTAIAHEGVSAGSRGAFDPALASHDDVDAVLSAELLMPDPNGWGELDEKIQVSVTLVSSAERDGQYKGSVAFHTTSDSPCPVENIRLASQRTRDSGFELTVAERPDHVEVQTVKRSK